MEKSVKQYLAEQGHPQADSTLLSVRADKPKNEHPIPIEKVHLARDMEKVKEAQRIRHASVKILINKHREEWEEIKRELAAKKMAAAANRNGGI